MKRIILIMLIVSIVIITSVPTVFANSSPDNIIPCLTIDEIMELFPEAFATNRISFDNEYNFSSERTTVNTYYLNRDNTEYELNVYSDGLFDLVVAYPSQLLYSSRSIEYHYRPYSYYYPIVDGLAQMIAFVHYNYNTSTHVNTITSCTGGGSDVALYGWGVYGVNAKVWGNAVSEGIEFIGLNLELSPNTDGTDGLTKSTWPSNPY
ncbi:MAG: hypothetical protein IIZ17_04110 [Eubacteriaceae bacterium]|nr:hypothetical protein [Eubacteriaceae bacterium]